MLFFVSWTNEAFKNNVLRNRCKRQKQEKSLKLTGSKTFEKKGKKGCTAKYCSTWIMLRKRLKLKYINMEMHDFHK